MSEGYYNTAQTEQLQKAIDHGLPIGKLMIMAELDENNRTEEYPAGVPVFSSEQMEQIRLGFEDGLNYGAVFEYADPSLSPDKMKEIRQRVSDDVLAETMEGIRSDDFEVTPDQVERHVKETMQRSGDKDSVIDKPFSIDQAGIRMVKERSYYSEIPVTSPKVAVRLLGEEMRQYDRELVAVVNCTSALRPINVSICSIGTINRALISPRELLKTSILTNSSSVILVHSHPSGDPTPSKLDMRITERLKEVYEMMDIQLTDHVIVGDREYYSFQEHGLMEKGATAQEREYHYKVDIREGWWMSCKVMLEDAYGGLHDTGQERFFSSERGAKLYKKMLEAGADESIAYYNSLAEEKDVQRQEGLVL